MIYDFQFLNGGASRFCPDAESLQNFRATIITMTPLVRYVGAAPTNQVWKTRMLLLASIPH